MKISIRKRFKKRRLNYNSDIKRDVKTKYMTKMASKSNHISIQTFISIVHYDHFSFRDSNFLCISSKLRPIVSGITYITNSVPRNALNAKTKMQLCIPIKILSVAKYFSTMKPIIQDIANEIAIPIPRILKTNLLLVRLPYAEYFSLFPALSQRRKYMRLE